MQHPSQTPASTLPDLTKLQDNELAALLGYLRQKLSAEDLPTFQREIVKLKTPRHYQEWWSLAQSETRLLIESHRDSWKSFFWSRSYPLFRAISKPGTSICLISYSEAQARKNLYWIKQIVETLEPLVQFTPKNSTFTWQKTFLHFTNGSTIEAKGFGSAMRGGHYDYIICDDILKDGSSMPHEDQENFFFGVITPACRKTGQIVVVGTPLEHGDLLATLEKNGIYSFHRYPVVTEGKVWFDEEYNLDHVERWKQESPNYWYFAREYLLQRINPEKAAFKESWIQYYIPRDLDQANEPLYKVMTLDPALSEKGDYNGIIVTGTDKNNTTYLLESINIRGELSVIIDRIFSIYERHLPNLVGVEQYGFQKYLKFWLEEEMSKRNKFFQILRLETGQKKSKAMRILGLQPKIELGKIKFRKIGDIDLVNQLLSFDFSRRDNEDDMIDAFAYQVPLWRPPDKDGKPTVPFGSFDQVASTIDANIATEQGQGYLKDLFDDMMPDNDDSFNLDQL